MAFFTLTLWVDHGSRMHTNYQFEFCPMCGGKCKSLNLKEHEPTRLVCSECDFIFYLDPKLVACAIVESEGKIVLLKRDIEPQKGKWVMPGGYVDRGEVVEAAALRETEEECGLKIKLVGCLFLPRTAGSRDRLCGRGHIRKPHGRR